MPATYDRIQSTTLSTATTTITFSSIASTWTDLRVVFFGTNTTGGDGWWRFNNDSTSLYSASMMGTQGSSALRTNRNNTTLIYLSDNGSISSLQPAFYTLDLFSYASSSSYKTCLQVQSQDKNGESSTGYQSNLVGLYRSLTPITEVSITSANTFVAGTIATLYGIKAA